MTDSEPVKKYEPEKTHKRKFSLQNVKKGVILKYSYKSKMGMIPGNPGKVNQDSYIAVSNIGGNPNLHFYAVCDGHGFFGRDVSTFIKKVLPQILENDRNLQTNPRKALNNAILRVSQELAYSDIDINFSGTTLISVLIKGTTMWCANVGDSRALIARQVIDPNKPENTGRHWMSIALSRDHKPDEPDESQRIMQCGGRIEAYQDDQGNPLGPARVWLRQQDLPGLAMSRSIGDAVANSVGVIPEPEILEFQLKPEDKFIVLGSDGVFEFITNEEAVKIVVPYWKMDDVEGACAGLEKEANLRWTKEEEVIDDITSVVLFLDVHK